MPWSDTLDTQGPADFDKLDRQMVFGEQSAALQVEPELSQQRPPVLQIHDSAFQQQPQQTPGSPQEVNARFADTGEERKT